MKQKKPTVAYLIYNTNHNGGNKVIFEHVHRLGERGYNTRLVSVFGQSPSWYSPKVKIESFISLIFHPPDILIATFWPTVWLGLLVFAKRRLYFVLGWEEDVHGHWLLNKMAKLAHHLPYEKIVISKFLKEKILKSISSKQTIHSLDAWGIDESYFSTRPHKKKKNITVLSVLSTYTWYKGADILVDAVQKLKAKHPEYKFILVSASMKSPPSPIFDHFYHNLSAKKLRALYLGSDFLLSTARSEGFFIPGLEAMANGCIFVTTQSNGVLEYVRHNENAYLIKSIDTLWKEDIIEQLADDEAKLKSLRLHAYQTADKYNWDHIIDDLISVIYKR